MMAGMETIFDNSYYPKEEKMIFDGGIIITEGEHKLAVTNVDEMPVIDYKTEDPDKIELIQEINRLRLQVADLQTEVRYYKKLTELYKGK